MEKNNRRPLWQVLCIFAAIFLVLSIFLGIIFQFYITPQAAEKKLGYYSVNCKNGKAQYVLPDDVFTLRQSFVAKDALSGYEIFVGFTEEKAAERAEQSPDGEWIKVNGELRIRLLDSSGNVLDDYALDNAQLNESLYLGRIIRNFDSLISGNVRGQTFTLEITGDFPKDSGVCFLISDRDYYLDGALTDDGAPLTADLAFYMLSPIYTFVRILFLAFSVGLLAAFTIVYFCAYVFRVKKHTLFFVTVLIMGLGYTALITPFAAPDETVHYYTAYRFANVLTGTEQTDTPDETVYVRACDTDYNGILSNFYGKNYVPTVSTYATAVNNVFGVQESEELIEVNSDFISGNYVCYAAAGFGIAIGKALHLSSALTMYLGRIMNLLLFAFLGACAVKKIPFGKNTLFVAALLPLTLQQVASCSYDAVLIAFGFYYLAVVTHLAYTAEKIRIWDIVQLVLCMAVFGAPKAGVYVVLAALLPIILFNKKLPKKQRIGLVCGIAACALVWLAVFNFSRLSGTGYSDNDTVCYSLGYIFENPIGFVKMWANTYFREKQTWLYSLFGSDMAWVNLSVEKSWAVVFVTLLFAGSIRYSKEAEPEMRNTDKIFLGSSILLCIAGFCAAAFLWTPVFESYVVGLQTRYIIPVLPMLLLLLRVPALSCRKDITNFLTVTAVLTNALYIVDALNVTMLSMW
ncbi:MAG: DUF2142 domain-containing protein [Candidatus Fimenecus sp.]